MCGEIGSNIRFSCLVINSTISFYSFEIVHSCNSIPNCWKSDRSFLAYVFEMLIAIKIKIALYSTIMKLANDNIPPTNGFTSWQGRSQTSEQYEASFERRRPKPLGRSGACPPRKFEIKRRSNAILSISHGIFPISFQELFSQ